MKQYFLILLSMKTDFKYFNLTLHSLRDCVGNNHLFFMPDMIQIEVEKNESQCLE